MRDLTFAEVCKFIKEDDPALLDAADSLLTVGLLLSPIALGLPLSDVEPALGLLSLKNELVKQGKKIFEKITAKDDNDPLAKQQRMLTAYGLICYTAYFDTLDREFVDIRRVLELTAGDRLSLSARASERFAKEYTNCSDVDTYETGLCNVRLPIPHPAETIDKAIGRLRPLYADLTKGVIRLLEALAAWEQISEKKRKELTDLLRQLPDKSAARFEAQYFVLCSKYHEFYTWANLHEHATTQQKLEQLTGDFHDFAARAAAYRNRIDLD